MVDNRLKRLPDVCSDGVPDTSAPVEAGRAIHLALAPLGQRIYGDEVGSVLAIRVREHSPHTLLKKDD